jgi:hypothetical protein
MSANAALPRFMKTLAAMGEIDKEKWTILWFDPYRASDVGLSATRSRPCLKPDGSATYLSISWMLSRYASRLLASHTS